MKDFRNLKVWEKAHHLTLSIYRVTKEFPKDEQYGLTNQIRRASSSISANIAEGCGKDSDGEFKRFLLIAMGSASELENHILLARDLDYLETEDYDDLQSTLVELKKMLNAFIQKLKAYG
jgi:four helix bundle protein